MLFGSLGLPGRVDSFETLEGPHQLHPEPASQDWLAVHHEPLGLNDRAVAYIPQHVVDLVQQRAIGVLWDNKCVC